MRYRIYYRYKTQIGQPWYRVENSIEVEASDEVEALKKARKFVRERNTHEGFKEFKIRDIKVVDL